MNEKVKNSLKIGAYFVLGFVLMFSLMKVYTYFFLTETLIDTSSVDHISYLKWQATPYTGKYKVFYPGTHTKQETGYFVNGKKNGEFLTYHTNGKVNTRVNYVDGEKDGLLVIYNVDGIAINKLNYVKGKRQGKSEYFYDSGELQSTDYYVDDKLEGDKKEFYQKGALKMESKFVHDKKTGTEKVYLENGKVVQDFSYSGGVLMKGKMFYEDTGKLKTDLLFDPVTWAMKTTEYDKNGKIVWGELIPSDSPATSQWSLPLPTEQAASGSVKPEKDSSWATTGRKQ